MIGGHASLRHIYAPINCASGCGSNNIEVIHAAVRAQHRGDVLYTQAEVNQIELDWESDRIAERNDDSTTITNLEAELAISNAFGNWPWIRP